MTTAGLQDPFGLAGAVLEGQYRVDEVIGEGGFGVVYRGRHLSLDQPIAIKVLKGLDGGDPAINDHILAKFRDEARLLYTLSQSSLNIVRALDFNAMTTPSGAWAPFMILEWLDGCSLADDLAERRARGLRGRSLNEAFAILEPAASGLAAAHVRHVAHRDIKPANVFLLGRDPGASQGGPTVKVLDFGIAKIMKEGESAGTKGTFASFTWLYAAPEQLEPRLGPTGLATDVYAFTLLLTELTTDRQPIDAKDILGILKAARDPGHRPTPRARGANIPDAVEAICRRALAVDPKDRFATIPELWAALVAARDGRGPVATAMHAAIPPSVVAPPANETPSASRIPVTTPASAAPTQALAQTQLATPTAPATSPATGGARLGTGTLEMSPSLVSALIGPPRGTRAPGTIPTPPPTSPPALPAASSPQPTPMSPPRGTHPPGYPTYPHGPPPGTAPPGQTTRRLPFVRADGTNHVVIVTIVVFVVLVLFTGTCAVVHGACQAMGQG